MSTNPDCSGTNGLSLLSELRDLTRRMLAAAQVNEWSEVNRCEIERLKILETYQALSPADRDAANSRNLLNDLVALNRELERLGELEKDAIAGQLKQLQQTKKASLAYTSNDPLTGG